MGINVFFILMPMFTALYSNVPGLTEDFQDLYFGTEVHTSLLPWGRISLLLMAAALILLLIPRIRHNEKTLAAACVLRVARPFLRDPAPQDARLDAPEPQEQLRVALAEERDRALAALKELEFDHRTGKISDEDYSELIGPLRLRVAEALRALEPQAESTEERVRAKS